MQLLFNPGLRVVFWVISNKDAHDTNDTSVCLRDNGDQTVGTPDLGWFFLGGGGRAPCPKNKREETSCEDLKTMVYLYFDEIQMFTSL